MLRCKQCIYAVFKFTPFLVKFTPFACPILCKLNFKSMFLYQFNYLCGQVLELCPYWPQTPHLCPSTYSKWDLSLVVFVLFLETVGLPRFLTTTKGSWTWTSGVSKTWLRRVIKLLAQGFPLLSTYCRVAVIVCMNKLCGDAGLCGGAATLTLRRIRGFLSNSQCSWMSCRRIKISVSKQPWM
jgi:hypothetical protein